VERGVRLRARRRQLHGLNKDPASPKDRREHPPHRRGGQLFTDASVVNVTAFISPYRADRDQARADGRRRLHRGVVDCPVEVCERRDPRASKEGASRDLPEFTDLGAIEAP
jgi:adenylylsulfate kinase